MGNTEQARENHKSRITDHGSREVLAVVMARGGSVGLPGKALRDLLGRPVLAYTLDHVRESKLITRQIVTSDSQNILDFARSENFEVIERPAALATNHARTDDVLRHAVNVLHERDGYSPDIVVMLYGNVPIRRGEMIDAAIKALIAERADSVQTIAPVGKMHPYWMFDRDGREGWIKKHVPNNVFRRQDLPPLYYPTGSVYVMKTTVLKAGGSSPDPHAFLGEWRHGMLVEAEDSVDIDTEKDLWVAEAMLRAAGAAKGNS